MSFKIIGIMIFPVIVHLYFNPCGCEDNDKGKINILPRALLQTMVTPCSVLLQNTELSIVPYQD